MIMCAYCWADGHPWFKCRWRPERWRAGKIDLERMWVKDGASPRERAMKPSKWRHVEPVVEVKAPVQPERVVVVKPRLGKASEGEMAARALAARRKAQAAYRERKRAKDNT